GKWTRVRLSSERTSCTRVCWWLRVTECGLGNPRRRAGEPETTCRYSYYLHYRQSPTARNIRWCAVGSCAVLSQRLRASVSWILPVDIMVRGGTEMPFSPDTKTRMFTRCMRHCCLCRKQCGTNIEAAHIIDEAAGGSNDEENGIPVCFDCHQEIVAIVIPTR